MTYFFKRLFLLQVIFSIDVAFALVVGSDAAVSRQAKVVFHSTDNDNTILGFAVLDDGFSLSDSLTTCTFNSFFAVTGDISLQGGTLFLAQDLLVTSNTDLLSGGSIDGTSNLHGIILPAPSSSVTLPLQPVGSYQVPVTELDNEIYNRKVYAVDWSPNDQNIVIGTESSPSPAGELKIANFNGDSFTIVSTATMGDHIYAVAWHPTLDFIAARRADAGGDELFIYSFNGSSLRLQFSLGIGGGVGEFEAPIAWHPNGNYLVHAKTNNTNELELYSFNTVTGALTLVDLADFSPNRDARSISFSPDGTYFIVGSDVNTIALYEVNGNQLVFITSLLTGGNQIDAVAWHPTENLILVGQQNNPRLLVYEFDPMLGSLTVVDSITLENRVRALDWHPNGIFFSVGIELSSSLGELKFYAFDRDTNKLIFLSENEIGERILSTQWSHAGQFLATGGHTTVGFSVWKTRVEECLNFINTRIDLKTTTLPRSWRMFKECSIVGNGNVLDLNTIGSIEIREGSHLTIEDALIRNLHNSNIYCLTNDAQITFSNCRLELSGSYTFSTGALFFSGDVVVTGTSPFIFTSQVQAKISSQSTLCFEPETTFRYEPIVGNKNLLRMSGETSRLFLNGCTLSSTRTGLCLSNGTVLFDNKVTLTTSALNSAEGFEFSNSLNIRVAPDALIDVYGFLCV